MRYPIPLVLALFLAACGGGDDNNKAQCVEGATQGCLLLDGSGGVQVCQGSGAWAICQPFSANDAEDGGCVPVCDPLSCGLDGCGGLCNQCLEFAFDDGDTDTAFGYSTAPDPEPSRIACMVRFELPYTNMKLTEFAAGWM